MSIFNRYAAQLAAMPSAPAAQPQAPRGRGPLFTRRPGREDDIGIMDGLAMIGQTLQGGESVADQMRARRAALESERQQEDARILADRLRARLSPMDGPNGSGTGAMPSIEEQMAALEEARLLNPQVAEQFAPVVTQRRMAQLTQGRPIEEQLAVELNPEQAGRSYATQFEDMPLAAGTVRTRGNQPVVAAPRIERFDDRFGTIDPMNPAAGATFSAPRGMTAAEMIDQERVRGQLDVARGQLGVAEGQLNLAQANSGFTLGENQTRFTNDGRVLAQPPQAPQANADQGRLDLATNLRTGLAGARRFADAAGVVAPYLPWEWQDRADLIAQLDTLKGNITFERLMDMKANSPNGASGLGAMSDNEARMLASTVAALNENMRPEELEASFAVIDRLVSRLDPDGVTLAPPAGGQSQAAPGRNQQSQGSSRRAYDAQGNSYVVRNGQWVRE